ncbi:MAG: thioredoxin domain-containing protein [Rickettsiales bacterium]|jgi:predicted DsbA family dithiol-disulfide isomerase|nr:thioredoxin domain-containing protein [Rickettsiales bacterium]
MTWTILILAVAIILYVFAGKLVKAEKKPTPAAHLVIKGANLVSIILLVVGVNRLGLGTSYYLAESNPAILQEMANNMQNQEREKSSREVKSYVRKHGDEMAKWAPVLGNENASKTIFVWSAADCPYCRRVHVELSRVLAENKDVRVVIKNFPVHGEISDIPGRWTIAAKLQSNAKAAALYEKIMDKPYWDDKNRSDMKIVTKNMKKYAKELGLDVAKLEKDINGAEVAQELAQVRELAQRFNVTGTPYLIIGENVFPGAIPYSQIVNALR